MATVEIIFRGDDTGATISANRAVEMAYHRGPLRCTSVIGCGEHLADAARRFAACPELVIGLHVSLNSEWSHPRFRPVLPADRVRSLVGEDGCFLDSPATLLRRGFDPDEAVAEIRAQLAAIRAAGMSPGYLDEHMGVGAVCGLGERLAQLAADEGLVLACGDARSLPRPGQPTPPGDRCSEWIAQIESAPAGRYVLITHPLCDDDESRAITRPTDPPGRVARDRDRDREALIDPRLRAATQRPGVRVVRYVDDFA